MKPRRLVAVLGTSTGVGKTWVTVALMERFMGQGLRVAARKPAQSFQPGETTDAEVLGEAAGEDPGEVCPRHRWYERPMAPPMAAEALGRAAFTVADLVAELAWPDGVDVGLVEGAGGVRSPLATDGDAVDFLDAVGPDLVVLVADAGLGTLNLVRMSADALGRFPVVVFLNSFDPSQDLHRANREWLQLLVGLTIDSDVEQLSRRLCHPETALVDGLPLLPSGVTEFGDHKRG